MPLIEINVYIVHKCCVCSLKENVFKKKNKHRKCHTDKILIYCSVGTSQGKIEASLQKNIQWHIKNVKNIKAFALSCTLLL